MSFRALVDAAQEAMKQEQNYQGQGQLSSSDDQGRVYTFRPRKPTTSRRATATKKKKKHKAVGGGSEGRTGR